MKILKPNKCAFMWPADKKKVQKITKIICCACPAPRTTKLISLKKNMLVGQFPIYKHDRYSNTKSAITLKIIFSGTAYTKCLF